jgi:predicted RNA polymerase sigma factor
MAELPAEQRAAIVLCDIQGMSYDEIADTLHISLGTVKSRLSRGRRKLRDYLQQNAELLPRRYRLHAKGGAAAHVRGEFIIHLAGWAADRWLRQRARKDD